MFWARCIRAPAYFITGLRAALGLRFEAVGGEDSGERSGSTTKTNYEQERAEAAEFVPLPNSATSAASCSINLLARGRKEITKSRKTGKHEKERVNVGAGGARRLGKLK